MCLKTLRTAWVAERSEFYGRVNMMVLSFIGQEGDINERRVIRKHG